MIGAERAGAGRVRVKTDGIRASEMEGCTMDFEAIKRAAEGYQADMTRFLRDLIAIPSESCEEEGVINRTILEDHRL